jgi:hypothetical protein
VCRIQLYDGRAEAKVTRAAEPPARFDDPNSLGFKTAQIFDRKGELLWEIDDPSGGKRTVVPLRDVSKDLINATLAAEDAHFYENRGFDPGATLRSAWIDLTHQGITGASTITQQLVRNVVLDPNEARQTTVRRKLREIVLAYEVEPTSPPQPTAVPAPVEQPTQPPAPTAAPARPTPLPTALAKPTSPPAAPTAPPKPQPTAPPRH